jgi:hypothetical protein
MQVTVTIPASVQAAKIAARAAPTMAEAARIYCDALRSAKLPLPVIR